MIKTIVSITTLFAILTSLVGYTADFQRPFEKFADKYYQMLVEKKFDELDQIAKESEQKNLSISDGQPQLAALYGGVAGCLSSGCRNRLSEAQWQDRFKLLLSWREQYPKSIIAEIALASYFVEHSWSIRGQGYSGSVKQEAWKPFYESMEIARKKLDESSAAAKENPGWYSAMLSVGLAQKWPKERFDAIFKAGIEKHPLYLPLYFNASAFFAPRWYGSPTELKIFIENAVNATRAQLGETLYARLNWSLWTHEMFKNNQADWQRMKAGFERMVNDYPDPWNFNNFGKFACLAQDNATVLEIAKKIGDQPIERAWWDDAANFKRCVDQAYQATMK